MKKLLSFGLFCLVIFSLFTPSAWAQSQECPYKAASQSDNNGNTVITLTAIVDSLTIHNVSVNRGNCLAIRPADVDIMIIGEDPILKEFRARKISEAEFVKKVNEKYSPRLAAKLGFGDTLKVAIAACKLLEIRVETDQGSWTTSFN